MIQDGDKIAVCISEERIPCSWQIISGVGTARKENFEVVFLVMNPGYNEVNYRINIK